MRAQRDRIAQAAVRVMRKNGLAATTLENIGEEAGLSMGAIYTHYDNKNSILLAAIQTISEQLSVGFDYSSWPLFRDMAVDFVFGDTDVTRDGISLWYELLNFVRSLPLERSALASSEIRALDWTERQIKQFLELGQITSRLPARDIAAAVIDLLRGAAHRLLLETGDVELSRSQLTGLLDDLACPSPAHQVLSRDWKD